MGTFVAVLIIVAVVAGVFLWQKVTSAAVDATAKAVNQKLLYKAESKEGESIVSTPLEIRAQAPLLDVIRALNAYVSVADRIPAAFKAVLYKSSGSARRITYALGNKAVPKTFEAEVSFASHGDATQVVFRVLSWHEKDGLVVGYEALTKLRGQVEAALMSLDASASTDENLASGAASPASADTDLARSAPSPSSTGRDFARAGAPPPRASGSSQHSQKKTAFKVVGIVLWLVGVVWAGIVGFYVRDVPVLLVIFIAGAICLYVSTKIKVVDDTDHPARRRPAGSSTTRTNAKTAPAQVRVSAAASSASDASPGPALSVSRDVAEAAVAELCPSCQAPSMPGAAFCPACGAASVAARRLQEGAPESNDGVAKAAPMPAAASRSGRSPGRRTVAIAAIALAVVAVCAVALVLSRSHSGSPAAGDAARVNVVATSTPAAVQSPEDTVADPELVAGAWNAQASGTTATLIHLAFVDAESAWAVGNQGAIVASSDGGWTWTQQSSGTGATLFGVAFADASRGWAVGAKGTILATDDGGASWRNRDSRTGQSLYGVARFDAGPVYAVGRGGVIVSSGDSGETWQHDSSGTDAWLSGVAFLDSGQALAVGDHGTILRSSEDSVTWTSCDSRTSAWLCGVCAPDSVHAWAVGSKGVIVATEDGGETWTSQHSGTSNNLYGVAFADAAHGWAVGEKGTLLTTSDGGASWKTNDGPTDQNLWGVGFTSVSKGCAVGDRGTILTASVGE